MDKNQFTCYVMMMKSLAIFFILMGILGCQPLNTPSNRESEKPSELNKKDIASLSGTYQMAFKPAKQDCTLNNESIDEDFVYQFDQEGLQNENLHCQISLNQDIFCAEPDSDPIWEGTISTQGKAKLHAKSKVNDDLKQSILAELPTRTSKNSVVVDFSLYLNFMADENQGYLQLNYQFPSELKTVSCALTLPFDFERIDQDK